MSSVATSAYIGEDTTGRVAVGVQRFVRHNYVPDAGPAMTWDHPETTCRTCDACRDVGEEIGWDAYFAQLHEEAPDPVV